MYFTSAPSKLETNLCHVGEHAFVPAGSIKMMWSTWATELMACGFFFRGLDFSFSQQYTAQTPHATTLKIVLLFMRTMRKTMLAEMQKSYSSDCSFHDGVFSSGVL